MNGRRAFVYDAVRTGRGKASPKGALHQTKPIDLVAALMKALVARGWDASAIEDVVLGCVTQIGEQGANLAKIAALYAGWPDHVPGATVNRFCTSGLDAIAIAAAKLISGQASRIVAGGVESMSRVPMFSDRGAWFADPEVAASTRFVHMALAADLLATRTGIGREALDRYAAESHRRAAAARDRGALGRSTVAVGGFDGDELIRDQTMAATLAALPPLSAEMERPGWLTETIDPRHTVGTAPGMADAASLVVLASVGSLKGRAPRAEVVASATVSVDRVEMLSGNVNAARKAVARAGLTVGDVDAWEVNESFAVVPLHFARELGVDAARLNANGGAISLGHPLGATGGVLTATLLDRLDECDGRYGVISICGGAGVATSLVLKRHPTVV